MRLFKKFRQKRRDKKEMIEEYANYSPLVLEVLEIAKECNITTSKAQRYFIMNFYDKHENRVAMLRSAPKHVQFKYLMSFNLAYHLSEIEAFMKLSESVNYSSILFDSNKRDQRALVLESYGCLLREERPKIESISQENIRILLNSSKIHKRFYSRDFNKIDSILTPNLIDIRENAKARVEEYYITADFSPKYSRVLRSIFFVLVENYGAESAKEIFIKFSDANQIPTLDQILYLASKWDELKDYPLDWSLEASLL